MGWVHMLHEEKCEKWEVLTKYVVITNKPQMTMRGSPLGMEGNIY